MMFLDCTFRDGGYYTNWDFDGKLVDTYLKAMEVLPVDIIEVGYRSTPMEEYFGQYFYCPDNVLERVRQLAPSKKVAIMFNEKGIGPDDARRLLDGAQDKIDIVRMAIKPERFDEALALSRVIKGLGFEVGFNLMYMSEVLNNSSVLDKLPAMNGIVDYFSFVDSYGGVYPEDVRRIVERVKEGLTMKIGFHGHDNMETAFANSIAAIESGYDIVDGTITGIGRGAGNSKTELLLTWASSQKGINVDFDALSSVVSEFEALKARCGWGTNLAYMFSGANSLTQQEAMDLLTRHYSMNNIIRTLQRSKSGSSESDSRLPQLSNKKMYTKALVIAGGPSAAEHAEAIKGWIEIHRDGLVLIHASSKNAKLYKDVQVPQIYCLAGDEGHRLESAFSGSTVFEGICVLPPHPRKIDIYIPADMRSQTYELEKVEFTDKYHDSHTAVALQAAINLGVEQVYAAGYDGYSQNSISPREQVLHQENEYMLAAYAQNHSDVYSLTPTTYSSMKASSVYSHIV